MYTGIASVLTAITLLFGPPPGIAAGGSSSSVETATEGVEILDRVSYVDESGYEVEYAIWRDGDVIGGDVSVYDPVTRDFVEMWIRGDQVVFEGVSGGEPFSGFEQASILYADPSEPACLGWIAIACAAAAALAAGCAFGWTSCSDHETNVPGGQGGNPGGGGESEGDGEGGGGDAEEE